MLWQSSGVRHPIARAVGLLLLLFLGPLTAGSAAGGLGGAGSVEAAIACPRTAEMVEARSSHTATLLADGKVLVVGGEGLDAKRRPIRLASVELFDPDSRIWSPAGNLSTARSGHTATLLPDGRVLVVGGET